jgi:hypothetical protein
MLDQLYPVRIHRCLFATMMFVTALLNGCTASKPFQIEEKPKIEQPREKKLPLSEYEATLNPVEFDRELEVVQKMRGAEQQQNPLEIPKDSMIVQEEVVQGFRIQIFSSSSVDETSLMRNLAVEKFVGDSIYVVYDAPVYKVRIGDFINRYEANQRLPEFVEKGYRDAWIVPDRIVQRKLVRVSISK